MITMAAEAMVIGMLLLLEEIPPMAAVAGMEVAMEGGIQAIAMEGGIQAIAMEGGIQAIAGPTLQETMAERAVAQGITTRERRTTPHNNNNDQERVTERRIEDWIDPE